MMKGIFSGIIEIELSLGIKKIRRVLRNFLVFTLILSWAFAPFGDLLTFKIANRKISLAPEIKTAHAAVIAQYTGGLLVYADTATVGTPKYKVFDDTTGFGAEQSASSVGAVAIEWIRVAASSSTDEWIIATSDAGNVIKAQVCTGVDGGVSCGTPTQITATAGTHGLRNFDVSYEQSSGDALLVYGTATADELRKIEWTGGAWTLDAAITTTRTTGTVEWVELTSRPSSNQIGIAYSDTNDDVSAYRWDGTAAADEATAVITATAPTADVRKFDITFEGTSGDMFVGAVLDGVSTLAYGTLVGTTWTITTAAGVDVLTKFLNMQEPGGDDDIGIYTHGVLTTSNTTEGYGWSGSAIVDGAAGDDLTAPWAANYMMTAISWMSTTYYAVAVFPNTTNTDDIDWWTMNSADAITDQAVNVRTRGAGRFLDLFDYPNADKVLLLTADANSDLWADTWDGAAVTSTAWTDLTSGGALELALSIATKDAVDFAFRLAPNVPTVTTQQESGVTSTSATVNGTITATGGREATTRGFAWGTVSNLSGGNTATTTESGSFGTGAFTGSLSSLTCNTIYYSRPYATNAGGTGYGTIDSFTTSACAVVITVKGALYSDEGVTPINGKTIRMTVATGSPASIFSATTDGSGNFTISGINGSDVGAGREMFLWVDGDAATRAFTFTKATTSPAVTMPGVDLWQNRIILTHGSSTDATLTGTSTTNANLSYYDGDNDPDIPFWANSGALEIKAGMELHVGAGTEFAPGGAVTLYGGKAAGGIDGNIHLPIGNATSSIMTLGGAVSMAGSLNASSTSIFNPGAQTITFTATTSGKMIIATTSPTKTLGAATFNGASGAWTFGDNASTTDFTITNGSVTAPSLLTVSGNFSNSATFTHNSGTVYFTGAAKTLTPGSTFNNVTMSGSYTIAPSVTWTIAGNADFTGGTFTPAGGTVTMNGTGKTLTSSANVFNNLTLSGTITTADAVAATGTMILSGSAINLGGTASTTGSATLSGTIYPQQQPVILNGIGATLTGGGTVGALQTNGTYTLSGSDLTVGTSTIITNGALTVGAGRIYTSTSTLTLVGSVTGAGTTTIKHSNLSVGGTLSSNVSFDASGGAITMPARTFGANVEIINGSGNAVTAAGNATSTNAFLINAGGSFTAPGATRSLYVGRDYTNYGTFTHNSGKVFFNGTGVQAISGATSSSAFNNVDFSGGGAKTFSGNATTTNLTIQGGSGAIIAPTLLSVAGNYTNLGTFTAGNGTTTFSGTVAQTISGVATGTSAFYNLEIINSSASTTFAVAASTTKNFYVTTANAKVEFSAGATSSMTNLIVNGQAANTAINLFSGTPGTQWNIYATGTRSVQFARVQDSDACSDAGDIDVSGGNNTDVSNNECWTFTTNVASTATSSANQTFEVNQAATAMSVLTITAGSGTGGINAADATGDLRIAIATSTVNMLWDTTKTDAIFGGTASSSAKIAACGCVVFEGGGSVAKVDVTTNFTSGDVLTISGLRFTSFNTVVASSTALQLFLNGANDISANAQDTLRNVAIYGKLALGAHNSNQPANQFDQGSATLNNVDVFRFKFTPTGENASNTPTISLSNISGLVSSNITSPTLYVDADNSGGVNSGDYALGGTGAVFVGGTSGTITFSTPFAATTTSKNYVLRANFTSVNTGDQMTFGLTTNNITASGTVSQISITPSGSVASITHFRPFGSGAPPTGGTGPSDTGVFGGTGQGGGAPTGGGESGGQSGGGSGQGGGAGGGIDLEPLLLRKLAQVLGGLERLFKYFSR